MIFIHLRNFSYFIIVLQKISCTRQFESQLSLRSFALSFRVKDCQSAPLHLFGFLNIVTWKHRLIVLIPIFHAAKGQFSTGLTHAFSATILHSSVLFPHEVSLFLTWFLKFPALLPYSRPSKKPQQIPRQQPLVPTLLLELGENQPRKQVSTSTVLVKVLHHLFEVFLCFHNSDFLEFGCKGNTSLC